MNFLKKIRFHISFEGERDSYPETFQQELNYQCSRVLTFACLMAFSWLPYIPIDRQLYPDEPLIVILRICFPVIGTLILTLRFFEYFRNNSLYLLTFYGAYLIIATGIITGLTRGDSTYVGGYILIICLLAMAPIRRRYAYAILFLSLTAFFSIGFARGMAFDTVRARYTLNDFIATAVVIASFIYILDSIRFKSWKKSKRIEQSQKVILTQRDQLEDQINLAGEIQKHLLPARMPDVPNASVAFTYHPMMGVGGDFVDVHYTKDGKGLGLFICDVSGHGVAAALISSMVKMALTWWGDHIEQPAEMLREVYNSLNGKISAQFVTASICYMNLETGLLRMASAGHPPITVLRKNGTLEMFNPRGKIINDMMPADYLDAETFLNPQDKVILYTDGITEAFSKEGVMYGDDRFNELLKSNRRASPALLCDLIMEELTAFTGSGSFEDDITILATEYMHCSDGSVEIPDVVLVQRPGTHTKTD
jgi:hypothetical protein